MQPRRGSYNRALIFPIRTGQRGELKLLGGDFLQSLQTPWLPSRCHPDNNEAFVRFVGLKYAPELGVRLFLGAT